MFRLLDFRLAAAGGKADSLLELKVPRKGLGFVTEGRTISVLWDKG